MEVDVPTRPRVLIADDYPEVVKAVSRLLALDYEIVGSVARDIVNSFARHFAGVMAPPLIRFADCSHLGMCACSHHANTPACKAKGSGPFANSSPM